jgi:hypothetical protein
VDRPGGDFWKSALGPLLDRLLARGFINPEDTALFRVTDDVDEAVAELERFYHNYHSVRTIRHELVIRLQRAPAAAQLATLAADFGDICNGGTFRVSGPLPLEADEPALLDLPRLVFPFNKRDHGRLRMLIDRLNGW